MWEGLCLLLLQQEPPAGVPDPALRESSWISPLHGSLRARYRLRWTSDQSDNDLYEYLALTYGDPEKDRVTASASARFAEDLDGERDEQGAFVFDSPDDTYRRAATARLYTAYLDVNRLWEGARLRAGRQILEEFPEAIPVDGGTFRGLFFDRVTLGLFGGRPVNLFESSPRGDATYGGWLHVEPWSRGRAGVEYLHLEDETAFGAFDDDLIGIRLEQGSGPLQLHARHTLLEGQNRETVLRVNGSFPDPGIALYGQANYLHERQQALSYALDPYAILLLDLEPYVQVSLGASKSFGAALTVDASAVKRELVEDADETAYNHEFARWTLSPRFSDWPLANVSWSVAGDFWQSSGDDFWTLSGDVSWRARDVLTLSAGTSYALYTLDAFSGQERERVRLVYASLRWQVRTGFVLDVRFSVEDSDVDRIRALEIGIRHAF
jgi:hypothetical protein